MELLVYSRARFIPRRTPAIALVAVLIILLCLTNKFPQQLLSRKKQSNSTIIPATNAALSSVTHELLDYYYAKPESSSSLPVCGRPSFSGKTVLAINTTIPSLEELDTQFQHISLGGHWSPRNCEQRQRIGVIVPFRNRWHHLPILVLFFYYPQYFVEATLKDLDDAPFNRGELINTAAIEALKREPRLNCFIFHDVDTLPENVYTIYKCHEDHRLVAQMATYQKKRNYKAAYRRYTGGVLSIWRRQFEEINGFSNEFWGWGGEDDDLANRIVNKGYDVVRDFSRTGRFYSLEHPYTNANPEREAIVKRHLKSLYVEGLNTTKSVLRNVTALRTFTFLSVDLSLSYKYYQGLKMRFS